eukprot:1150171-Pelagomonas_calceolata.AAC.7
MELPAVTSAAHPAAASVAHPADTFAAHPAAASVQIQLTRVRRIQLTRLSSDSEPSLPAAAVRSTLHGQLLWSAELSRCMRVLATSNRQAAAEIKRG